MNPHDLLCSPPAYRLGWTLLHSLWEAAAVGALLWLVLALLRRSWPQVGYLAAGAAMAAILVLTAGTFLLVGPPASPAQPPAASAQAVVETTPAPEPLAADQPWPAGPLAADTLTQARAPADSPVPAPAPPAVAGVGPWPERCRQALQPHLPWLVAAWLAGVLALSLWRAGGWLAAYRLRVVGAEPVGPETGALVERLMCRLGLRRPIRVVQSLLVQTPMVIGWLRPVVLLPLAAVTGLTPAQLEAILAHELAHVRRLDYLANLLQAAMEILFFYHPVVWWISRRMRAERERCCDDVAVAICGDRVGYVEALAAVEEARRTALEPVVARAGALAAGGSGGKDLIDRARRLLGLPDPATPASVRSAVALLVVAATLAVSIGLHLSARGGDPAQPGTATRSATRKADRVTAILPSGAEIELVAVSYYPDKDRPWWRPDGALFDAPLIDPSEGDISGSRDPKLKKIELVFRLAKKAEQPGYESQIKRSDGGGVLWAGRRTLGGTFASDLKVIATNVPADSKTVGLDLLVAAGPWETVGTCDERQAQGPLSAATPAARATGEPCTVITARFDPDKQEARIIGIDKDGVEHVVRGFDIRRGVENAGAEFLFQGRTPSQFKSFTLQTRPFELVHLTDVSLAPGQVITDPKLTPAPPASQPATLPVKSGAPSSLPATGLGADRSAELDAAADRAVRKRLAEVLPRVEFSGIGLADVVQFMRDVSNCSIDVDWAALKAVGVEQKTPVNVKLRDVTFENALRTILDDVGRGQLGFRLDEGTIKITSKDVLARFTIIRVYDARDLVLVFPPAEPVEVGWLGQRPPPAPAPQPLTKDQLTRNLLKLIQETIDPKSWLPQGKSGSIREMAGQLIITQTEENHRGIVALVTQLREGRAVGALLQTRFLDAGKATDQRLQKWLADRHKAGFEKDLFARMLSEDEVKALLAEAGKYADVRMLPAPKLTVYSGLPAAVRVADKPTAIELPLLGEPGKKAKVELVQGLGLLVKATVTADRKGVSLTQAAETADLKIDWFFDRTKIAATVTVPDGQAALFRVPVVSSKVLGVRPETDAATGRTLQKVVEEALPGPPERYLYLIIQPKVVIQRERDESGDPDAAPVHLPPATQPATQPAADAAEIERLIKQLGSEKFAERQEAQVALVGIGKPAMDALRRAAQDKNVERGARASAAIAQIARAIRRPDRVAIFLVTDPPNTRAAEKVALDEVKLADDPTICDQDIVVYEWDKHVLQITADAFGNLPSLRTGSLPFVVVADGHRCYLGEFHSPNSSYVAPIPTISLEGPDVEALPKNAIRIYVPWVGANDPRSDPRIRKALAELGKLKTTATHPTSQPATRSATMTSWAPDKGGVQLRLYARRQYWPADQEIELGVDVRNKGDQPVAIVRDGITNWRVQVDGQWYEPGFHTTSYPVTIKPGEQITGIAVPLTRKVGGEDVWAAQPAPPAGRAAGPARPLPLAPGRHTVLVAVTPGKVSVDAAARERADFPHPDESNRVVRDPLHIEIVPPDGTASAPAAAGISRPAGPAAGGEAGEGVRPRLPATQSSPAESAVPPEVQAQPQQPLRYHTADNAYAHIGPTDGQRQAVTDKPPDKVSLPRLVSDKPLFSRWQTAWGDAPVALDTSRKGGPYDLLYLDSNLDGNLADEAPITAMLARSENGADQVLFNIARVWLPGEDGAVPYHLRIAFGQSGAGRQLHVASAGWHEGAVTVGDKKLWCLLVDNNANGRFNDPAGAGAADRIRFTALDRRKFLGPGSEPTPPNVDRRVEVQGQWYGLEAAPDGSYVRVGSQP